LLICVALLPARSIQRVCHDTLPWLICLTHDLPSSFALKGYPADLADSQSARFSLDDENRACPKVHRNYLLYPFAFVGMSEENRRNKSQFRE
jgi:hypothetical protein